MSIWQWVLDWKSITGGAAAVIALITRWLKPGLYRSLVAHLNRERQHAATVTKLWRAEDDIESLGRQIEIMDERIEDLLELSSDVSSNASRERVRSRIQLRKQVIDKSSKSDEKPTFLKHD